MKIDYIPRESIINIPRKNAYENYIESDFVLKALRIKNDSSDSIKLLKYQFDLKTKSTTQLEIIIPSEGIPERIENLKKFAERFLKKRKGIGEIFRKGNLQKTIGTAKFWMKDKLTTSVVLKPGQETGFLAEHFRIAAKEPVDELVLIVHYEQNNVKRESRISIPIVHYENKNSYIFPVKGIWHAMGNWDDPVNGHRKTWSQEFAFDLIQIGERNLFEKREIPNSSFPYYGKEVIAIADGEVYESFNTFPDNPPSGTDMSKKEIIKYAGDHGLVPVGAGNYVIIDHGKGEYSFCAHLIPGSIPLKTGDKVKQGQVIGKLGNSGHSEGPHLHFQLMNKPSHLTGKGLPCHFTNITNCLGESVTIIDQSNSVVNTM